MILALESSCDETAVAIFDPESGIAAEWVHSQMAVHSGHGGVVPDIATREHLKHFGPMLGAAMAHPAWGRVSQVAVTRGPGLAACLAVGIAAAKAAGTSLRVPVIGVNHLRAHAWSPLIPVHAENPETFEARLLDLLPHLGLIVSGGNTLLFSISRTRLLTAISGTRDDAAGEALDKGAKLLGLGYPGGPEIETLARGGKADAFDFPRGLVRSGGLDLSFSGLKTSLRYRVQAMEEAAVKASLADLAASYQRAVIDSLSSKAAEALEGRGYRSVGLSGGVANNAGLRAAIGSAARANGARFLPAEPGHTGDNAAMVGFAAWIDAPNASRYTGAALRAEPGAYL